MRHLPVSPADRLYRQLAGILTRSGFVQLPLDTGAAQSTRRTAFVMDALKVDIDLTRGPAVNLSAHDGLISADWIGWRAHFGPATPVEVITAAAIAARVVETRARIVASIRERSLPLSG
jgi:hypothetical protein